MVTPEQTAHVMESAARATKTGGSAAVASPIVNWAIENSEAISLLLGIGGFITAVAGVTVTWYYSRKRYQLMLAQHREGQATD